MPSANNIRDAYGNVIKGNNNPEIVFSKLKI